tara:strand:- start:129 stop:371 length:243 start_codon:yes stop_codon:yes gene_type:complete
MKLEDIEKWFLDNPKELREEVIPFGTSKKISRPISVLDIINHRDTMKTYINMLQGDINPEYYQKKVEEYINEYNRLNPNT